MAPDQTNPRQGTHNAAVLKALAMEEMHGTGSSCRVEQIRKGTLQVKPGSVFPSLPQTEKEGSLSSSWGEPENPRRAKSYTLASAGRCQLAAETKPLSRIALAITGTLEAS